MPKTKIICTIGPASGNITVLRNMMLSGMDVARLNFSHGNHTGHKHYIGLIRQLNKKYKRHIRILQDLEGYRIRIGKFKNKKYIELRKGQEVLLTNNAVLTGEYEDAIPFDYTEDLRGIKEGSFVYIDDGNISLSVKSSHRQYIKAKVVIAGVLKENKGVNIPGAPIKFKGLTDKDKVDLEFGIRNKVDFIAQSFVRDKDDILLIRALIRENLPECKIIAKIENQEGIKNIDRIIDASDGIMIARGDMGVSIPIYKIPIIQKVIIKKCNRVNKFVITATQMLESMTENILPTRAEATDVSNALIDGSDFLMLSAETAAGMYPVEAVKTMNRIIKFTEENIRKLHNKDLYKIMKGGRDG